MRVGPFELVVFGGTGDLAYRKLLPALFLRDRAGQIVGPSRIVAVSRRQMSDAEYRQTAREAIERHVAASERDAAGIDSFLERVSYVPVDGAGDEGWPELKRHLGNADAFLRLFYLAVAPDLVGPICPAAELGTAAGRAREGE